MNLNTSILTELNHLSVNIGKQALLVQGAGGNTSIKDGNILWVKASGKWLAHAANENIFVPVNLENLLLDINTGKVEPITKYAIGDSALRPSIETTLHALLPQRVVIHVHSINTLCWAVNQNGRELINQRLHGLNWAWIPYHRPGLALMQAVKVKLSNHPTILVLANHGLVIAADSCEEAEQLLAMVEAKLARQPRQMNAPEKSFLTAVTAATDWQFPIDPIVHSLAIDQMSFQWTLAGAMYPDHVVFLQAKAPYLVNDDPAKISEQLVNSDLNYILIKDKGVLVNPKISLTAQQMLVCQALLLQRLQPTDAINYLSDEEVNNLINWEAEKYRQKIIL